MHQKIIVNHNNFVNIIYTVSGKKVPPHICPVQNADLPIVKILSLTDLAVSLYIKD